MAADLLKETVGLRYVIGAIIAAVIFTVGIITFIQAQTVPRDRVQRMEKIIEAHESNISRNERDIIDLKVLMKESQVMQKHVLALVAKLEISYDDLDDECIKRAQ